MPVCYDKRKKRAWRVFVYKDGILRDWSLKEKGCAYKVVGRYFTKEEAIKAEFAATGHELKYYNHPWREWGSKQNTRLLNECYKAAMVGWRRWAETRSAGLWVRELLHRPRFKRRKRKPRLNWTVWQKAMQQQIQICDYQRLLSPWKKWAVGKQGGLITRKRYVRALAKKRRRGDARRYRRNAEIQMRFEWPGIDA